MGDSDDTIEMTKMRLLRRHKYILIALGVYWPLVFTLTHIPVPQIARQSGMSDKTMHLMAYFALTFLVWYAVNPYCRVRWDHPRTWWIVGTLVVYGAVDEYLQGFVGRTPMVADFIANLFGILLALGVMSVFHFWAALLTVAVVSIFVISNMSNLTELYPQLHLNTVFHFSAYTGLCLIWMQHIDRYLHLRRNRAAWLLVAAALPLGVLAAVLAAGQWFDKTFWWPDAATAVFGMTAAILASRLTFAFTQAEN